MSIVETVTYLEMTDPEQLNPSAPVPGVELAETRDPALIQPLHRRIGAPHQWGGLRRTHADWTAQLANPHRRDLFVMHGSEAVGLVELEARPGGETEILAFGLVPESVGHGFGGHALTLAVREAWAMEPVGADAVSRVWLHTSTLDHPNALPNYRKRGFRPFRTVRRARDDKDGRADQPPAAR